MNKFKEFLFVGFDVSLMMDKQTPAFSEPCPYLFILPGSISYYLEGS
jgi:hypothetical protein